jgi:hypothetical protein
MHSRAVICLGLFLAVTLAGLTHAQDQPAEPPPPPAQNQRAAEPPLTPRTDAVPLDRRIAGLESQIARLLDEVRRLRAEVKGQPPGPLLRNASTASPPRMNG